MKSNIVIPSMKHRPVCLLVYKPNNITSTTREEVMNVVMSTLNADSITKKTFDRLTHFTKDERFLYIPNLESTRKFLKFQVENDWMREKAQIAIDPTVGAIDILTFKNHLVIRIMTNNTIQEKDLKLAKVIGSRLSTTGRSYVFFHDRKFGGSSDVEYFMEIAMNQVVTEWKPGQFSDMRVFDKVFETYGLSIAAIVEEMDIGVELACAPYDIKEYMTRLSEIDQATTNMNNVNLSEEKDDDIAAEMQNEVKTLTALIEKTNELIRFRNVPIETAYFKMNQQGFEQIKAL